VVVWGLNNISPLTKKSGWLCSLRFATVAKPPWCAKGGDTPLPVGNGVRSRKNRKLPVCDFFCCQAASMPPRRYSDTAGRTMPAQSRLTFKINELCPTVDVNKKSSPNSSAAKQVAQHFIKFRKTRHPFAIWVNQIATGRRGIFLEKSLLE